jgi:acyl-CoA synthetase (AMP-forming)/AMP-acid ligase II
MPDEAIRLSSAELVERSREGARYLRAAGVGRGDRVGVLGPNAPEWILWALSVWNVGGVVVPMSFPLHVRDRDVFRSQVQLLARAASLRRVVAHPRFGFAVPDASAIPWDTSLPVPTGRGVTDPGREEDLDQPAIIQFTSGTTALPKGVALTHRAILAGLRNIATATDLEPASRTASWLPFFHDMGLMYYLLQVYVVGCTGHVLPTEAFAQDPAEWFRLLTRSGAHVAGGPTSAWAAALRVAVRSREGFDLSGLRIGSHAAETIDPAVVDRLMEFADTLHLDPTAIASGYGMAEATLALTVSRPGARLRIDRVDLNELTASGAAVPSSAEPTKRIVSCGFPLPEVGLRIMGPGGESGEREIGEIHARGPSMMTGYVGDPSDPFVEGWFPTGDLGYLAEGELFVTGRAKDVIIVMGRNYSPDDIEWAAARVDGIRAGRCVAFVPSNAPEGEVTVVAEPRDGAEPAELLSPVRQQVLNVVGVTARTVLIVPKGTITKTTSGKLQRAAIRDAYAEGRLQAMALAVSGPAVPRPR